MGRHVMRTMGHFTNYLEAMAHNHPEVAAYCQKGISALASAARVYFYVEATATGALLGAPLGPGGMIAGGALGFTAAMATEEAMAMGVEKGLEVTSDFAASFGEDAYEALQFKNTIYKLGEYGTKAALLAGLRTKITSARNAKSIPKGSSESGILPGLNLSSSHISQSMALGDLNSYKFQSKIFDKNIRWKAPDQGTGQTYKVYQRNDIDWNMVRTGGDKRFIGKTNAEAARQAGLAPQLDNSNFSTLHHIGQNSQGPLVEAATRYHGIGKPGQHILHNQFGRNKPNPEFPIDRLKFELDTKKYWKDRINEHKN